MLPDQYANYNVTEVYKGKAESAGSIYLNFAGEEIPDPKIKES